jgi:aspartyl-tRNA(Asn)/glutamyl-tRNA(Gln) amidotransferase subunit B
MRRSSKRAACAPKKKRTITAISRARSGAAAVDCGALGHHRSGAAELPDAKRARFVERYQLPAYDAGVIAASRPLADYYEAAVAAGAEPKLASNWIMTEVLALLRDRDLDIGQSPGRGGGARRPDSHGHGGHAVGEDGEGSLRRHGRNRRRPARVVERLGLRQIHDADLLSGIVDRVLAAFPDEVEKYRSGKTNIMGHFVGQVMKETRGQANPGEVNRLLRERLGS